MQCKVHSELLRIPLISGSRPALFFTPFRAPQCKDFVHSELLRIASQCAPPEVKRFQILGVSLLVRLFGCNFT